MPIRRALGDIDGALRQQPAFEPREAERVFTLACVDFGSLVIVPPLLARLRAEAPGVDLVVRQLRSEEIERQLAEGQVDLAVGVLYGQDEPWMVGQRLFEERFVCVVRADHPTVRGPLTLDQFVALDHALISPRGRQGGFVDRALARHGRTRRVALTVPHFLAAPIVVAGSDLILTVPERIARAFAKMLPLQIVEPPLEVEGFAVTQYWHERQARDPAHVWFRGLVVEVGRAT